MYPVVYALFYLLSLLPWGIMYVIADAIYVLVYYVIGYRKSVVMNNLLIAFPEKTEQQRIRIAKEFYHNFIDTFIETIKLLTISKKAFDKRCIVNAEVLNEVYATGQNVQIHTGHFFNWEFGNLGISKNLNGKLLGVYMPLTNKNFNKLIVKLRTKFNTILISVPEFRNSFHNYNKSQYALGLVADQNPGNPMNAAWMPFFGKMAPFYNGPEKGAKRMNTAVVMMNYYKIKRGYYKIDFSLLTTTPNDMPAGMITKKLIEFIEAKVKERPANYLWSHRRWKWEFDETKYGHLVVK